MRGHADHPLPDLKHCPRWARQQNSFTAPDAESFGREPGYAFWMVMDSPPSVEMDRGGQTRAPRSRFWRDALRRRLLASADLIAAAAASVVVAASSALKLPPWKSAAAFVSSKGAGREARRKSIVPWQCVRPLVGGIDGGPSAWTDAIVLHSGT